MKCAIGTPSFVECAFSLACEGEVGWESPCKAMTASGPFDMPAEGDPAEMGGDTNLHP